MTKGSKLAKTRGKLLANSVVASKVQWEGGVAEAISYGLDPSDFEDQTLAMHWTVATASIAAIDRILAPFYDEGGGE